MMKFITCSHLIFIVLYIYSSGYANNFTAHTLKVIDADTIHVLHQGQKITIRLYGIDAPEKKQNYGKEATSFLMSILQNKEVAITPINKDRYGRMVAIVHIEGESLQEILLEYGLAWVYPYYCKMAICTDWKLLQRQAKDTKKGLWQDKAPVPPWEWRRK